MKDANIVILIERRQPMLKADVFQYIYPCTCAVQKHKDAYTFVLLTFNIFPSECPLLTYGCPLGAKNNGVVVSRSNNISHCVCCLSTCCPSQCRCLFIFITQAKTNAISFFLSFSFSPSHSFSLSLSVAFFFFHSFSHTHSNHTNPYKLMCMCKHTHMPCPTLHASTHAHMHIHARMYHTKTYAESSISL